MVESQTLNVTINTWQAWIAILTPVVIISCAWSTLRTTVNGIVKTLDTEIKPDLKNVRERVTAMETKIDVLWEAKLAVSHSPRKLTTLGSNVLDKSGIKTLVDKEKENFLALVKAKNPPTAYDAERMAFEVMQEVPQLFPEQMTELKNGAYNCGVDIQAVFFVGSIYLRDIILPALNFDPKELDKPQPTPPPTDK